MPPQSPDRAWLGEAVRRIEADGMRSADTHLMAVELPGRGGVDLYLKDESAHLTGSLKHRLARSLFLYALCNGWIGEGTTVIEASSGSTAVSEAYFARLIGLPFVAVVPATTSHEKIALIEAHGARCHMVDRPSEMYAEAQRLADECGDGHYMDQFTYAERATDWRGNNNIAESIYEQLSAERHPVPAWIVTGAGTGGTAATIGRFIRYRRHATRLMVADPENSVFHAAWREGSRDVVGDRPSRIEGIGRPRVEPSFMPRVIDEMCTVPDAASIATARWLSQRVGRPVGASTGTSTWAALGLVAEMDAGGDEGSIVTLLCDSGDRYLSTYYDDGWLRGQGIDISPYAAALADYDRTGDASVLATA